MLPLPGSPASSWAMYRSRQKATFEGADLRVCTAFWLFGKWMLAAIALWQKVNRELTTVGLVNNVLYVIILSAALDLVGPNVPKGVVLLADVIPSFLMKLCAPYFIHAIPYSIRILLFVGLSTCGMLLIALTPAYTDGGTISTKMAGVMLASLSGGGGELSFLGLTHFYGPFSLAAWGSGTGGAGLIGAGAYAVATTSMGLSIKKSLLASSFLPVLMLVSFFIILPRSPLKGRERISTVGEIPSPAVDEREHDSDREEDHEDEGLLQGSFSSNGSMISNKSHQPWQAAFINNIRRSRSLFFP